MAGQSRVRLSDYGFVFTIAWIGFVLAISFLETPLRFSVTSVAISEALQIGRVVFHALNYCEWTFAVIVLTSLLWSPSSRRSHLWYWVAVMILVTQTLILFLMLDDRTEAVIQNRVVADSSVHTVYVVCEVAKLIALGLLATSQIRDFRQQISQQSVKILP